MRLLVGFFAILAVGCATRPRPEGLNAAGFRELMATVAAGWNRNDARRAADCFAEDAVYEEPPAKQLYRGRAALFDFFGGNAVEPPRMQMEWHHLVFDEASQIGAGEYTFRGNQQYHGIVIVKIAAGKIFRWREVQVASDLPWETFVKETSFDAPHRPD